MIKLTRESLKKPDNPFLQKIANYLLYVGLPAINTFFVAMQATGAFDTKLCFWGVAGSSLLISLFKGLTKFSVEGEA